MKKIILLLFIISITLLTACTSNEAGESDDAVKIYTTIYPLEYIISEIGQDLVSVESIYPNEVDAHHYEPSSKQITQIASAQAFIYLSPQMETSSEKIKEALSGQDILITEISEEADLFEVHDDQLDPHIWLDPDKMIDLGKIIKEKLQALVPEDEATIDKNFTKFEANMKDLDQLFTEALSDMKQKKILAVHPAYGYWEDKYGVEQLKVARIGEEPSQKELADITKTAEENKIKYIIFESNHQSKLGEMLINELEAEKVEIHTLETRTDKEVANQDDYLTLMKENLKVLEKITQ